MAEQKLITKLRECYEREDAGNAMAEQARAEAEALEDARMQKDAAAAIEHDLWFNPHLGPSFATEDSTTRSHAVISVPLVAVIDPAASVV